MKAIDVDRERFESERIHAALDDAEGFGVGVEHRFHGCVLSDAVALGMAQMRFLRAIALLLARDQGVDVLDFPLAPKESGRDGK